MTEALHCAKPGNNKLAVSLRK